MITSDELKNKIGLTDKEADVYFALLKEGSGYASAIASVAGINRSTTYQVLEKLHEYGIVLKYNKGNKFFYTPAKPRTILDYIDSQEQVITKRRREFLDLLPELNIYFATKQKKPKMVFYTRKQEVERLYYDALQPRGQKEVTGLVSLNLMQDNLGDRFFKKYAEEIYKHKMPVKMINYDDHPKAKKNTEFIIAKYFSKLPKELKPQIKVVKEDLHMTATIFISAHKSYLIDMNPPEFAGMILSNQDMTKGFYVIFKNLWDKIK